MSDRCLEIQKQRTKDLNERVVKSRAKSQGKGKGKAQYETDKSDEVDATDEMDDEVDTE